MRPTIQEVCDHFDEPSVVHGLRDPGGRVALAIFECKKPVIAAINGDAVGIGATMTLAMDVRLVAETARIGFVFGKIGIVPEACSSWLLPRIVGLPQALEWAYRADLLSAEESLRGRLVRSVCSPERLLPEAYALAHRFIDGRSSVAVALTRQMLYRNSSLSHPVEAHKVESLALFYTSIEDGKEGVRAFLEKRAPRFKSNASVMPPFYPWWD
jgi:enoyl-CoA hydratase/carnithine racemase